MANLTQTRPAPRLRPSPLTRFVGLIKDSPDNAFTIISYAILIPFVAYLIAANHQFRWPWAPPTWHVQATLTAADGRVIDINDVKFVDAQHGWVVGDRGSIFATSNGGKTWTRQVSGTTQRLRGIDFLDTQRGWAVGSWNTILATEDGGLNWRLLTEERPVFPASVRFVDEKIGWMAGLAGELHRTEDGGRTWTEQRGIGSRGISGLAVVDADYAWIGGARASLRSW